MPGQFMRASPIRNTPSTTGRLRRLAAALGLSALAACASPSASGPGSGAPRTIEPTQPEVASGDPDGEPNEPCRRAIKGDSPVAQACREGGVRSAKATMKELVKEARGAGLKLACDDCHIDSTDFSRLDADAPGKFRNLLATVGRR
jgi:HAMP domain-containing protein